MNNFAVVSFLVPAVAVILVCTFYFLLAKKAINKRAFKKFTLVVIVIGLLLNFAWEMLQMPLFENMQQDLQTVIFCALASVADVIMLLLLYYSLALVYKDPLWIKQLTAQRVIILILVGGVGAILAEMRHLSAGTWAYSESMPLVPIVNAGLSPVLQFMLLPVLVYYLSFYITKKSGTKY